jgi:hypothetical protein
MPDEDKKAQDVVEQTDGGTGDGKKTPPAGPHAKDRLTDKSKTPGTGSLTETDEPSVEPGSG